MFFRKLSASTVSNLAVLQYYFVRGAGAAILNFSQAELPGCPDYLSLSTVFLQLL